MESITKETIQTIIMKLRVCPSVKTVSLQDYKILSELLQQHPEKEKKKVALMKDISIRRYPGRNRISGNSSDYQLWIIKTNGSEESISWTKCLSKKIDDETIKLSKAFRTAIDSQIKEYHSKNQNKICELCGSDKFIDVDHIIKFKTLRDNFLLLYPNHPKLFDKNKNAQEIFREEDREFSKAWQHYHLKEAKLRYLCHKCNIELH
jgi:hypothetical protein